MNSIELLNITSTIGYLLLVYGAEIYRVEDSIIRICNAYGYKNTENKTQIEVFAIPSSLLITIQGDDNYPHTISKRVMARCTDFDKVDALNNLSRKICTTKPSYDNVKEELERIDDRKTYSYPIKVFSFALVGFTFALFFGGKLPEACVAAVTGAVIKLVSTLISKVKPNIFLESVLCSMVTALIAIFAMKVGLIPKIDNAIIGPLMNLVPGITITNCMRDFIAGDYLAGMYTLTEALIIAVGMAVGAATIISMLVSV